mmetsp:Transcript_13733/g.20240  ORF Transcript_13733/g.20240 Transcript_13733/m.20240 type:complete len:341 (-) Transcript_13733:11-1033(-)
MESAREDVSVNSGQHERQSPPWTSFKSFVQQNESSINMLDELISQVVFWAPYSIQEKSRWREITYGLLSLQRMAIDMTQQDTIQESHGTSISTSPKLVPVTSLRVGITIIQSLLPTILQISKPKSRERVRLYLERIKFALRILLIGSYWYQLSHEKAIDACGLVMNGGQYDPNDEAKGVSVAYVRSWRQRQSYVGRRSGRRVVSSKESVSASSLPESNSILPLVISELWHSYRPLHWAEIEYKRSPSLQDWAKMLVLDISSLLLLQRHQNQKFSSSEIRRRKVKLFLYLLRSPVFDRYSKPALSRLFRLFGKLPLVGSLLETYLWDWLHYWKHPFAAEED